MIVFALVVQRSYAAIDTAAKFKDPNQAAPLEPLLALWRPLAALLLVVLPALALAASFFLPGVYACVVCVGGVGVGPWGRGWEREREGRKSKTGGGGGVLGGGRGEQEYS